MFQGVGGAVKGPLQVSAVFVATVAGTEESVVSGCTALPQAQRSQKD
jgi:hypothetical protein